MFKFQREQKVFNIDGIRMGGQPGEYPTVLIGSIFYNGHKIVKDAIKGEFDRTQAQALTDRHEELSEKTGNPFILDVVGATTEALIKYVDFISEATEAPFLVDAPSAAIRIPVMKHLIASGLGDRAIYNSIDYNVNSNEVAELKELGVKSAILLAYNPKNPFPKGRLEILQGSTGQMGLLEAAKEAEIENTLVDTAVLDAPSIGLAAYSIYCVKNEFGLPAGCGPANGIAMWNRVRDEYGPNGLSSSITASSVATLMMGANFVLYGMAKFAESVFPACALVDAMIAYNARNFGIKPKTRDHPLYKIF